jgi:DNA-binding NtrC family response regulator
MHEIQRAAQAFKLGAADSLVKPFDLDATLHLLRCTLARQEPPRGTLMTPEEIAVPRGLDVLVGQSASMRQLATTRSWVADTTATVLITGESGVGKAWVASALHQARPRRNRPVVVLHGAGMPEGRGPRICVGSARGARLWATPASAGVLAPAHTGSLVLNEGRGRGPPAPSALRRMRHEREGTRLGRTQPPPSMAVSSPPRLRLCGRGSGPRQCARTAATTSTSCRS